jgi:signal transduction histidine kinase
MWLNFKISQKGLILVTVPLLFEVAFIILLTTMLRQSEIEAQTYSQSRQIVSEINYFTKSYLDIGVALIAWKATKHTNFVREYDDLLAKQDEIYHKLESLSANSPSRWERLQKLHDAADRIRTLTTRVRKMAEGDLSAVMEPTLYRRETAAAYEEFTKRTDNIVKSEEEVQAESPTNATRLNERFRVLLVLGVAVNIALTFLLAKFFSDSITKRLSTIMDNNRRLAKKEPLLAPVDGSDEIAKLDEDFRHMVFELNRSENAKQEYLQMISHDLRTPLSSLKGTLAVTVKGAYGDLNEKGKRRMAEAERETERLISMINEILDIERLESGTIELNLAVESVSFVVDQAKQSVSALVEANNMTIVNDVSGVTVLMDRERILRVLINLLGNAIKFSDPGSSVEIFATEGPEQVTVNVRDHGRGIPESALPHIFDRFWQAQSEDWTERGGSGLGLAVCKAIVEAHHGTINAQSEEGKGTVFSFSLPRDESRESTSPHPGQACRGPQLTG